MRPGELGSARRADLDAQTGRLLIRYATGADGQEKSPKNGKPREIVVAGPALDAISRLPVRVGADARIFLTYRGRPFNKGNLAYFWRPIGVAWKAGNPAVTLHHLRHACATMLVETGLSPADVAIQLGHQDGGRLVQTVCGHPDHGRSLDRVGLAFSSAQSAQPKPSQLRSTAAGDAA